MPPAAPSGWVHYWIRMLLPGPPSSSLARPADQDVVARAADQRVVARSPDQDVVAVAAVLRELDRAGRQARGVDDVVAAEALITKRSFAASASVIFTLAARPGDVSLAGVADDRDRDRCRRCR